MVKNITPFLYFWTFCIYRAVEKKLLSPLFLRCLNFVCGNHFMWKGQPKKQRFRFFNYERLGRGGGCSKVSNDMYRLVINNFKRVCETRKFTCTDTFNERYPEDTITRKTVSLWANIKMSAYWQWCKWVQGQSFQYRWGK